MLKQTRQHALNNQIQRLNTQLAQLKKTGNRYAWIRLIVFVVGLFISGAVFYFLGIWPFAVTLLVALILFSVAVYYHRQISRAIARFETWQRIKQAQIARMNLDWAKIPGLSAFQPRFDHPFEADLDLVGDHSLHRLLDTAVSHEGSRLLRNWLATPQPDYTEVICRQQLVKELIPLSLFRGKLIMNAALASGTRKMWDAQRLTNWLNRQPRTSSMGVWLVLFGGLVILNIVLLALNLLGVINGLWQFTFVLYFGLLMLANTRLLGDSFDQAPILQDALQQLGAVFKQLETFSYRHTPGLKTLCAPFLDTHHRPSKQLGRVTLVVTAIGIRQNLIMWLILNAFFPWDIFFAYRLNQTKATLTQHAPAWMSVWFELESLSSLANLAYLNPTYTMPFISNGDTQSPHVVQKTQHAKKDKADMIARNPNEFEVTNHSQFTIHNSQFAIFTAEAVGHPLLPDNERICNNFSFANLGEIAIITGSNMAGKSTFLRTVGINLALAYAGGPVNATLLHTDLFRLFTAIKVTDSVTNGISYFYAEVKRLKSLLLALEDEQPLPLFFFIDEIFRGTNNRERFIGSKSYIQTLAGKQGVGLISTHDLELAKLADEAPNITNFHFRDDVDGSRMAFDYLLHPGPCPTTNALKIMRLEGLPVDVENPELI